MPHPTSTTIAHTTPTTQRGTHPPNPHARNTNASEEPTRAHAVSSTSPAPYLAGVSKAGAAILSSYRPSSPGIEAPEDTAERLELGNTPLSGKKIGEIRGWFVDIPAAWEIVQIQVQAQEVGCAEDLDVELDSCQETAADEEEYGDEGGSGGMGLEEYWKGG